MFDKNGMRVGSASSRPWLTGFAIMLAISALGNGIRHAFGWGAAEAFFWPALLGAGAWLWSARFREFIKGVLSRLNLL